MEWSLPAGVWSLILADLSVYDLGKCACVATEWRDVINSEPFCKKLELDRAWRNEGIRPRTIHCPADELICPVKAAKAGNLLAINMREYFLFFDADRDLWIRKGAPPGPGVGRMCFSGDALIVAMGEISIFEIVELERTGWFSTPTKPQSIVDVGQIVAVVLSHEVRLYARSNWVYVSTLQEDDEDWITCADSDGGTHMLAYGHRGGIAKVWNVALLTQVAAFTAHEEGVARIQIGESAMVTSASNGWDIKVWDTNTWECYRILRKSGKYCDDIALFRRWLLVQASSQSVDMWDIVQDRHVRAFHTDKHVYGSHMFLEEGKLTIVGRDGIAEWDFLPKT